MAEPKNTSEGKVDAPGVVRRLAATRDPEVREYIADLRRRYAKYARPIEEVRKVVDKAMGKRTLTEILYEMRGCDRDVSPSRKLLTRKSRV